ncbi:MAG: hypothetical protein ACOYMP_13730 [Nodosilinea sp.]
MYDRVSQALQADQLQQAASLLQQWQQENPADPWLELALGQYWQGRGELDRAQAIYTRLLQNLSNPRLLTQTRGALQRLEQQRVEERQNHLQAARDQPGSTAPALLVLHPVAPDHRPLAAQGLAQVMQLDPYTARQRLSSQHWRLYRVGTLGELGYLCQHLNRHQVPSSCVPIEAIRAIPVLRVLAILAFEPQIRLVVQLPEGVQRHLTIPWTEISQWLMGQLPLYESVVDLAPWGKLKRAEKTQDYAEVIDWHLPRQGYILRFCDRTYRHRQSCLPPDTLEEAGWVAAIAWKNLKAYFQSHIQTAAIADFSGFGAGAIEFIDVMPSMAIAIDLLRTTPCPWDYAFHLYSGMRFLKPNSP